MKTSKTILLHNITLDDLKIELIEALKVEVSNLLIQIEYGKTVEYLTKKEVAKILKISVVTVDDWRRKRIIQAYRVGNRIRFKSDEIEMALIKINPPSM